MSFLKSSTSLRAALLRPVVSPVCRPALPIAAQRLAHQDYGSGKGDPVGENPQDQPPAKTSDIEHPGPPPPDVGQGSGTTPTKGTSKGHNTPGESQSSEGPTSSHPGDHSVKGAKPKILDENPPSDPSEDVKQHNKEMDNRAERAAAQVSNEDAERDKVPPSFWSGRGGRDRDP